MTCNRERWWRRHAYKAIAPVHGGGHESFSVLLSTTRPSVVLSLAFHRPPTRQPTHPPTHSPFHHRYMAASSSPSSLVTDAWRHPRHLPCARSSTLLVRSESILLAAPRALRPPPPSLQSFKLRPKAAGRSSSLLTPSSPSLLPRARARTPSRPQAKAEAQCTGTMPPAEAQRRLLPPPSSRSSCDQRPPSEAPPSFLLPRSSFLVPPSSLPPSPSSSNSIKAAGKGLRSTHSPHSSLLPLFLTPSYTRSASSQ